MLARRVPSILADMYPPLFIEPRCGELLRDLRAEAAQERLARAASRSGTPRSMPARLAHGLSRNTEAARERLFQLAALVAAFSQVATGGGRSRAA